MGCSPGDLASPLNFSRQPSNMDLASPIIHEQQCFCPAPHSTWACDPDNTDPFKCGSGGGQCECSPGDLASPLNFSSSIASTATCPDWAGPQLRLVRSYQGSDTCDQVYEQWQGLQPAGQVLVDVLYKMCRRRSRL